MRTLLLASTAVAVVLGAQSLAQAQTSKPDSTGAQTQHMNQPTQSQSTTPSAGAGTSAQTQAPSTTTGSTPQSQNQSTAAGSSSQTQAPSAGSTGSAQSQAPTNNSASSSTTTTGANQATGNDTSGNSNSAQQTSPKAPSTGTASNRSGTNAPAQAQDNATTNRPSSNQAQQAPAKGADTNRAEQRSGGDNANVNAQVNISEQQRTRLGQSFARLDVKPVNNVNFRVSVGTVVPRDVRLERVPSEIVEIAPQFRGYSFFAVRDEIVIVEPSSLKIVAVLPRSGGGHAAASSERKVTFSDQDRAVMRKHVHVRTQPRVTTGSASRTTVIVGERVPDSVEIRSFPEEVYRESPRLREYRYIEEGDHAYVVEPGERRIIEEID